jgi:hypothetical protein
MENTIGSLRFPSSLLVALSPPMTTLPPSVTAQIQVMSDSHLAAHNNEDASDRRLAQTNVCRSRAKGTPASCGTVPKLWAPPSGVMSR